MAVNDLTFNQVSTLLKTITDQATGTTNITPTNTSEFVSVAQTALKTGYDPLNTAISQVLTKTIFSARPYSAKFKNINVSNQRYGNITRKLSIVDSDPENDARFELENDKTPDMFAVKKPNVLQTNFYGANVFSDRETVYRDQLDCSFNSPDEFQRFVNMLFTNIADRLEQYRESLARATIANFIGGIYAENNSNRVVHLLSEYNAATGKELTATTIYDPANYAAFMAWVYARVGEISELMTERTKLFQTQITGKEITRHTPAANQKVYLSTKPMLQNDAMALANTFHDNYLKYTDYEAVNFWQSIDDRMSLNVKPSYLKTDGTITTPAEATAINNIFGIIFDDEALGYTQVNEWMAPTNMNVRGGYTNYWYHFTLRFWNDFTEKACLLLLD